MGMPFGTLESIQVRVGCHLPITALHNLIASELRRLFGKPALRQRAAPSKIARPTDCDHLERLPVVTMVIVASRLSTIGTLKFLGSDQVSACNCLSYGGMGLALTIPNAPPQTLDVPIATPVVVWSIFHLSRHPGLLHDLVMERLKFHHHLIRDTLAALSCIKARDGRLVDTRPALDFLLRQVGIHQVGNEVLRVHVSQNIANALVSQVQKPLSKAIGLPITIAL